MAHTSGREVAEQVREGWSISLSQARITARPKTQESGELASQAGQRKAPEQYLKVAEQGHPKRGQAQCHQAADVQPRGEHLWLQLNEAQDSHNKRWEGNTRQGASVGRTCCSKHLPGGSQPPPHTCWPASSVLPHSPLPLNQRQD